MSKIPPLAILLVAIGVGSLIVGLAYSAYSGSLYYSNGGWQGQGQYQNQGQMMTQWTQQYSYTQQQTYTQQQSYTTVNSQISMDQAKSIAGQYLASLNNPNLAIREIMEFQYNFYVMYYEKDTGFGAFEMLIWKQVPPSGMMGGMMGGGMMGGSNVGVGYIMPEPGPNMMWNTKYGMMGGWNRNQGAAMTVTKDQALQIAQTYLDQNVNAAKVEEDGMQFYGYYTMDFTVNGKIAGMLSVNGYTGQVWYHTWHGAFVQEIELT